MVIISTPQDKKSEEMRRSNFLNSILRALFPTPFCEPLWSCEHALLAWDLWYIPELPAWTDRRSRTHWSTLMSKASCAALKSAVSMAYVQPSLNTRRFTKYASLKRYRCNLLTPSWGKLANILLHLDPKRLCRSMACGSMVPRFSGRHWNALNQCQDLLFAHFAQGIG